MTFFKMLKNSIEIENAKHLLFLDDMILDMHSNKKFNPIEVEEVEN